MKAWPVMFYCHFPAVVSAAAQIPMGYDDRPIRFDDILLDFFFISGNGHFRELIFFRQYPCLGFLSLLNPAAMGEPAFYSSIECSLVGPDLTA
jgi:hypothetical protein